MRIDNVKILVCYDSTYRKLKRYKNRDIAFSHSSVELYLNLKIKSCGVLPKLSIHGKKFVSTGEYLKKIEVIVLLSGVL